MLSLQPETRKSFRIQEQQFRPGTSSAVELDRMETSRDVSAEAFVSSFLSLQHEVASTVEKGLSKSFELDAYMRQAQAQVDGLLEQMGNESDAVKKKTLNDRLDRLLEEMCDAQLRTNLAWNHIDEKLSAALQETESSWRKAETFFRSKQKRGEARISQQEPRAKPRKAATAGAPKTNGARLNGAEIARPSLIPKRSNPSSLIRKAKSSTALDVGVRKLETQSSIRSERPRSVTPEKVRQERRAKQPTAAAPRRLEKQRSEIQQLKPKEPKEKDKKLKPVSATKKRRVNRGISRVPRRNVRDDSDDTPSDDSKESSDPSYRAPSESSKNVRNSIERGAAARNTKQDPDEPRYCVCNSVSYGHMVGCDNDTCVIEWFHFVCVGLKAKPRGKWFCPSCREGDNCKQSRNPAQNEPAGEGVEKA